jgi:hypothetical protein
MRREICLPPTEQEMNVVVAAVVVKVVMLVVVIDLMVLTMKKEKDLTKHGKNVKNVVAVMKSVKIESENVKENAV